MCKNRGNPAGSNGQCRCECQDGFTGLTCEDNIDDCKVGPKPCMGHGSCTDGIATFTCDCHQGYSGYRCQNRPASGNDNTTPTRSTSHDVAVQWATVVNSPDDDDKESEESKEPFPVVLAAVISATVLVVVAALIGVVFVVRRRRESRISGFHPSVTVRNVLYEGGSAGAGGPADGVTAQASVAVHPLYDEAQPSQAIDHSAMDLSLISHHDVEA